MAAFIAKQMVGNQLSAVKGAVGGDGGDDGDDKEKAEEEERERQEAIKEAEDRRKEKHRKMEEEREKMRQDIRDKYNIKKKEEIVEATPQEEPNPLMRKKKTPEELAAEAEQEELDDFTSKLFLPLSNALEPSLASGIYVLQFQPTNCAGPTALAPIL
ncbi:complexin isoform X2 [Drosophila santomea]|uniref:complexin isoform X2 n=1 Tax=Drosophila santomea TaxID=129105 RepID=UPI001953C88D|nr:complexin isoform X2 [Drosophila santomea]